MSYPPSFYTQLSNHLQSLRRRSIVRNEYPPTIPTHTREALFSHSLRYGQTGCLPITQEIFVCEGKSLLRIHEVPLKNLLNQKILVLSYDWINERITVAVAKVIPSGKKMLYRIKLKSGREIIASQDHKFFVKTQRGIVEKSLKHLEVGDKLAIMDRKG